MNQAFKAFQALQSSSGVTQNAGLKDPFGFYFLCHTTILHPVHGGSPVLMTDLLAWPVSLPHYWTNWDLQEDLTKQWRGEKDDMERLQSVKEEIDRVNLEIQGAERDYDLNRAAELKYGTLMDLQKQLKGAEVALEKQVNLGDLMI